MIVAAPPALTAAPTDPDPQPPRSAP
jgi:hypothetical protein